MEHTGKDGSAKFRRNRGMPLTGVNVMDMIITDLGVIGSSDRRSAFELIELAPWVSYKDIRQQKEASYIARIQNAI